MSRSCLNCRWFSPPEKGGICGKCEYPVPGWMLVHGCGSYLSETGNEAGHCKLYSEEEPPAGREVVE